MQLAIQVITQLDSQVDMQVVEQLVRQLHRQLSRQLGIYVSCQLNDVSKINKIVRQLGSYGYIF